MKKLCFVNLLLLYTLFLNAQLAGNYTVGLGGDYPSFNGPSGLFAAINSSGASGNLRVAVISDIKEGATNPLLGGMLNNYSLSIIPAGNNNGAGFKIEIHSGIIFDLHDCSNITIDGRINEQGRFLSFVNYDRNDQILRLSGQTGGSNIVLRNNIWKSNNAAANEGCIEIAELVNGASGYKNIQILKNLFQPTTNNVGCAIYIRQPRSGVHANLKIDGNEFDNLNGRLLYVIAQRFHYGSVEPIEFVNNHVYNSTQSGVSRRFVNLIRIDLGSGHTVDNNFFGGSKPNCQGSQMTMDCGPENVSGIRFIQMDSDKSNGAVNNIQGNTFDKIKVIGSSKKSCRVYLIKANKGNFNIGNSKANSLGNNTINAYSNPSIELVAKYPNGIFVGIHSMQDGTKRIIGNKIGGINSSNIATNSGETSVYGIKIDHLKTNKLWIRGNKIGGTNRNMVQSTSGGLFGVMVNNGKYTDLEISSNQISGFYTTNEFGGRFSAIEVFASHVQNTLSATANSIGDERQPKPSIDINTGLRKTDFAIRGIYLGPNSATQVLCTDNKIEGLSVSEEVDSNGNAIYLTHLDKMGANTNTIIRNNRIGGKSNSVVQNTCHPVYGIYATNNGNVNCSENTISGITMQGKAIAIFAGIFHNTPNSGFNVTISSNQIGKTTVDAITNPAISIYTNQDTGIVATYGIHVVRGENVEINENKIGGIKLHASSENLDSRFRAIGLGGDSYCANGDASVIKNIIGSENQSNNIVKTSNGSFFGIYHGPAGTKGKLNIDNNIIGSITTGDNFNSFAKIIFLASGSSSTSIAGNVLSGQRILGAKKQIINYGIHIAGNGKYKVSKNTFNNIEIDSRFSGTAYAGILNQAKSNSVEISGNEWSKIRATNGGKQNTRLKAFHAHSTSGGGQITRNFISEFDNASRGQISQITGLQFEGGNWTVANNIILLGDISTGDHEIYGIYHNLRKSSQSCSYYFNSIQIGGPMGSVNTENTYAFYKSFRANNTVVKNNVFVNKRKSGRAISLANVHGNQTNWTSDHNILFSGPTSQAPDTYEGLQWKSNLISFSSWKTASAGELNSKHQPIELDNSGFPTNTEIVNGVAQTGTGITSDYVGSSRDLVAPDAGAYEFTKRWIGLVSNDWYNPNNWKPTGVPNSGDAIALQPTAAFSPHIGINQTDSARCQSLIIAPGASLSMNEDGNISVYNSFNLLGSFKHGDGTMIFSDNSTIKAKDSIEFGTVVSNGRLTFGDNIVRIKLTGDLKNSGSLNTGTAAVLELIGSSNQSISSTTTLEIPSVKCVKTTTNIVAIDCSMKLNNHLTIQSPSKIDFKHDLFGPAALEIEKGAELRLGSITQICPNLTGYWDINGAINFNGIGNQQLAAYNYSSIIVSGSGDKSLTGAASVVDSLALQGGIFRTENHPFTLLSTESTTARIPEIKGGQIIGDIIMQRYIPASPSSWRMLATPCQNQTIAAWNDNFITSGFEGSDYPSFTFKSIYGYDEKLSNPVKNSGYVAVNSVDQKILPEQGYWAWCGNGGSASKAFIVDTKGPANTGVVGPLSLSYTNHQADPIDDGWNLMGNPYPSPIDFSKLDLGDRVEQSYWIYDPTNKRLEAWNEASQTSTYGNLNGNIASSQAFWLKTNEANQTVTFHENDKTTYANPMFKMSQFPILTIGIKISSMEDTSWDQFLLNFSSQAKLGLDPFDTPKLYPFKELTTSISGLNVNNQEYCMLGLPDANSSLPIDINIKTALPGKYAITFENINQLAQISQCIWLEDLLNGTRIEVKPELEYNFTSIQGYDGIRFRLHFSGKPKLLVTPTSCSNVANGQIEIRNPGNTYWNYTIANSLNNRTQIGKSLAADTTFVNLSNGEYIIQFSNRNLCGDHKFTDTIYISTKEKIKAGFLTSADTIVLPTGKTLYFADNSEGASSIQWTIMDSIQSHQTNFKHDFDKSGIYQVVQTVFGENCTDSSKHTITVLDSTAQSSIKVYHSKGNLIINCAEPTGNLLVEIFATNGKKVLQTRHSSTLEEFEVPLNKITEGIYLVRITSNHQLHFSEKLKL